MNTSQKLQIIKRLSRLTQEKLAQKFDVSFATLNSWINNHSKPRREAGKLIDEMYKEYTGQKVIPTSLLKAKKLFLSDRSNAHPGVLKKIAGFPDIQEEFVLSLTYNSNGIEGSTLSENETAQVIFRNRPLPNKSLIEQIEAKNHQAAFEYLIRHLAGRKRINEKFILKLHGILMNSIRDDAGFYRNHGVRIVGSNVPTANFIKIPYLMDKLVRYINRKRKDIILHASKIHSRFEQIHPFSDGNGRVGRLLLNAILIKANFPPAMIMQENKQLYYTYLQKAQTTDDASLLEDFICDAVMEGFEILE